jgi:hypothetical protein
MNYKEDDSFFTTVLPPFICFGWSVKSWLLDNDAAKFRYIRDYEIESEFWNVAQVNEVYPGIKTIAIVINPWARMYYAYQQLLEMKSLEDPRLGDLSQLELDSFTKFIKNLPPTSSKIGSFWFSITTPICKWIENADYILIDTSLQQDFRTIQDYFLSDSELVVTKELPNYKEFYNNTTREIVATVFKEDIARFGYEF